MPWANTDVDEQAAAGRTAGVRCRTRCGWRFMLDRWKRRA